MRILHVTDTHLTSRLAHFRSNADAVGDWLPERTADLVIHTGDVSMDGAGQSADLVYGRTWLEKLGHAVHAVPGNHDVGDTAALRPDQQVDAARLAAWRDIIGPDRWSLDREGWRLIGLNAMLCGTELAEEREQLDWLAAALDVTGPVALFLHKPLFIDDPLEEPRGYWSVRPEPRRLILAMLARADVRLVASGHLHIWRHRRFGDTEHVWAPSTSFVVGDAQEPLGGVRVLGAASYDVGPRGVTVSYHRPPGLDDRAIDPVLHEVYPRPQAGAAS